MAGKEKGGVTVADVQGWEPRDKTLSVYVSERTELVIEALKDLIPLRSKAEVGRQAIDGGGLRSLPHYAEACKVADRIIAERDAAASRAAVV